VTSAPSVGIPILIEPIPRILAQRLEHLIPGPATHLVVGRPIINASDPAAAFREMMEAAR